MKNVWIVTASVAAALFCGCRHTHVDQVPASDGRQDWYKDIRANYPGFRPPRLISPGVSGYAGPAAKAPAPAEKYSAMDTGIEAVPVDPEVDFKPEAPQPEAPKAEAKPEAKVEAPEVKADVKADAPKADVKADAPKAEVKADAPKAEVKPENAEAQKIEPPDPTGSEIYVVQYGDTLGAISKKFYGSVRHTNLIKKANSDIITNANVLKVGMKLIIPKL